MRKSYREGLAQEQADNNGARVKRVIDSSIEI